MKEVMDLGNGEHNPVLHVLNLKKYFDVKKGIFSKPLYLKAVDGINFSLKKGESIAIVGESGSGKTTLGKTILRLYEPTEGKIIFKGKDIALLRQKDLLWYRRKVQLVQQDPFGSLPYFFTIERILEEPLVAHGLRDKEERKRRIYDVLTSVRLLPVEDFIYKYPHMLSGGQLQRTAIARALILNPELIVADEPVSMLDASVRVEVLNLLKELQQNKNISFLYITHDLATTMYFSDRIFIMYAGQVVEKADALEILENSLHPYTAALFKAIPEPDAGNKNKYREVPAGEPPNLINPPSGCHFYPRCPYAMERCKAEEPPEVSTSPRAFHEVKCWLYAA